MIKKIILSLFFLCLLISLSIKLFDPTITSVELGKPFMTFISRCSIELNDFKIEIPSIPSIPYVDDLSGFEVIVNAFVSFINGITVMLNFVVTVLNVFIQVLQFLFIILKNLINFRDTLVGNV